MSHFYHCETKDFFWFNAILIHFLCTKSKQLFFHISIDKKKFSNWSFFLSYIERLIISNFSAFFPLDFLWLNFFIFLSIPHQYQEFYGYILRSARCGPLFRHGAKRAFNYFKYLLHFCMVNFFLCLSNINSSFQTQILNG